MYTRGQGKKAAVDSGKDGTVLTKPWEKGGRVVNIDPVPPPFLRSDARENRFGDGSNNRMENTVTPRQIKKSRARRRNQIAKATRRANR